MNGGKDSTSHQVGGLGAKQEPELIHLILPSASGPVGDRGGTGWLQGELAAEIQLSFGHFETEKPVKQVIDQ